MVEAEAEAGLARLAAGRRRPTGKYYSWSSPYRAASSRQHRAPCLPRREGGRARATDGDDGLLAGRSPSLGMRNLLMLMADDERFDETSRPLFNGSLMRAMPQSLVCAPARMSLLTGQRPHILGPVTNHAPVAAYLHPSLVEIAKENGWATAAVGKVFHQHEDRPGYTIHPPKQAARLLFRDCAEKSRLEPGLAKWNHGVACKHAVESHFQDEQIASSAIVLLDRLSLLTGADGSVLSSASPYRGFVLLVGFLRPHVPLNVPASYMSDADVPRRKACYGYVPSQSPVRCNTSHCSRDAVRYYYAARRFVHDQMLRVLAHVPNYTMVVRTADHGIALGEGRIWGKGVSFSNLAMVPLEIRIPWRSPLVARDVESLDLLPTIVMVLGWRNVTLPGRSLLVAPPVRRAPVLTTSGCGASIRGGGVRFSVWWAGCVDVWRPIAGICASELVDETTECAVVNEAQLAVMRRALRDALGDNSDLTPLPLKATESCGGSVLDTA